MTRRSRLFVPLIAGILMFAAYWFFDQNRSLIGDTGENQNRILNALLFIAWLPLIAFFIRLVDLVFFDVLVSRRGSVQAPLLLREIVSIVLYIAGLAWAISAIYNYKVTAFLATGTVLAAILGLALQETLGNLFAGIALHLEDSFSPGDVVRSGEYFGIVEAVRWRGTRLRTFNNNLVIVPNSMLARERLEVYPRNNFNARVLQIAVDYNMPPATVIGVLTQAAAHVDGVVQEMPCFARVAGFNESSVLYEIKYFMSDYAQRDRIDADIRKGVWYALKRNSIPIPVPIRSFRKYEEPTQGPHPDAHEILDVLSRIDVLTPIGRTALEKIAEAARVRVYSRGETIIRQGDHGDSMFIVHDGAVSVRVDGEEVARLEGGDFFGEMALLTGELRAADVVAVTDVLVIEIVKNALQPVMLAHPDLATSISAKVAERRGARGTPLDTGAEAEHSVLSRIRAYFGL